MADRTLKVIIAGDAGGAVRAFQQTEGASDSFGSKVAKVGGVIAGAFATKAIIDFGKASVKAAQEDEQSQAALAKTLDNVTHSTKDQVASVETWIDKLQRATGVADDRLRPALASLVRSTGDVSTAQKDLGLAMDIATGTGKDLGAVSEVLGKALNGNLGPLKKLDPALSDLIKDGSSTDEVFQALSKTFGGQTAAAAETTSGKMQRAKIAFSEMQEEIGYKLIPVITQLADFITTKVIPAISSVIDYLDTHRPVLIALGAIVGVVLVGAFTAWAVSATAAAVATIAAAAPFIAVAAAVAVVAAGIIYAYTHFETFRTTIETVVAAAQVAFEVLKTAVTVAFDLWVAQWNIAKAIVETVWGIIGPVIIGIGKTIGEIVATVSALFHGDWSAAWEHFKAVVKNGIDLAVQWFVGMPARILEALAGIGSLLVAKGTELVTGLFQGISDRAVGVFGWFRDLPGQILSALGNMGHVLWDAGVELIKGFIGGIASMFGAVKDKLGDLGGKLTSWKGPPEKDAVLLYNAGQLVIGGFIRGLESMYGDVHSSLGGLTNSIGAGGVPMIGRGAMAAPNVHVFVTLDGEQIAANTSSRIVDALAAA